MAIIGVLQEVLNKAKKIQKRVERVTYVWYNGTIVKIRYKELGKLI